METNKLTDKNTAYIQHIDQIVQMVQEINFGRESLGVSFNNAVNLFSLKPDILNGNIKKCHSKVAEHSNCCNDSGQFKLMKQFECSSQQNTLAIEISKGNCKSIDKHCSQKILGHCIKLTQSYCCFQNVLAKIIHYGAKEQFSKTKDSANHSQCSKLTLDEINKIDFSLINFDEFASYGNLTKQQEMFISLFGEIENNDKISG